MGRTRITGNTVRKSKITARKKPVNQMIGKTKLN
jgi:hypothetical protein